MPRFGEYKLLHYQNDDTQIFLVKKGETMNICSAKRCTLQSLVMKKADTPNFKMWIGLQIWFMVRHLTASLGLKRGKERGYSKYLAEILDASEIRCMISAPSQEILKKVIPGDDKCITLFRD